MPTRVERLKKRSTRVADKALKKLNKVGSMTTPGSRSAKVLNKALKKGAKIDKKIVKTKARVAKRAVKKDARVTKRAVKKDARALNRRVKKATPSAAVRAAYKAKKAAKMKKGRIAPPPVQFLKAQDKKKGTFKPRKK